MRMCLKRTLQRRSGIRQVGMILTMQWLVENSSTSGLAGCFLPTLPRCRRLIHLLVHSEQRNLQACACGSRRMFSRTLFCRPSHFLPVSASRWYSSR